MQLVWFASSADTFTGLCRQTLLKKTINPLNQVAGRRLPFTMTFSRIIMIGLVLSLLRVQASFASPQAKEVLLSDVVFTELLNVKDIPDSIVKKLSELAEDQNLTMANPDEDFQSTDVVYEKGLPRRRLLWGVLSKDYCLIHYEQGGIARSSHFVLFKRYGAKVLWDALSGHSLRNFAELRQLLKADTLSDSLPSFIK
jgi:hypothetical protein